MKKFTYTLSLLAVSGILFTGCYTQLATRDRDYSDNGQQQTYGENEGYSDEYQNQDTVYDDSSEYYGDNYDSTGYDNEDNSYYDRGYNSPYYYDDFYYNYPTYRRYFWGYHPSIVVGFGWNSWFYDPFYCNYWDSWYYPGSWSCLPFYYYYPSPYFYGYNYYNGFGYPYFTHNYYTHRERTRDISRLRDLGDLRGGRDRGIIAGNNTGSAGRNISGRTRDGAIISTTSNSRNIENSRIRNNTRNSTEQLRKERNVQTRNSGRINPETRKNRTPASIERKNSGKEHRYLAPRSHYPNRREYTPKGREQKSGNYVPRERKTSRSYSPPSRNNSPRSYSPPQRSYSPPQRSYNPPSHSSGGSSRSGGSSSGRSRR